jgi:hypothetical protein
MKQLLASLSLIVILASCSAEYKKVYVLSHGEPKIDTDNRKISASGSGHLEQEVIFHDDAKVDLEISSQAGNKTVSLEENGIYILNIKKDTIIGSWVNYTAPKKEREKLSIEDMEANIDSLQQIIDGKVSAEKKTFFILPNHAVRITPNQKAQIITPFHQMTSLEVNKGETPEVYRFYMISEARATLLKLKALIGETDTPVNEGIGKEKDKN